MTLNKDALNLSAAANTLFNMNKPIGSQYDLNVTFGTVTVDETELAVCYPVGFNITTGKYAPWMAPDPTVVTVTMTGVTSGTWTLTVNGVAAATMQYNATAAQVVEALRTIGYIATVALASGVYTITFDDEVDIITPPTVTGAVSAMAGDVGESATAVAGTAGVPSVAVIDLGGADGGTFTITVDGENTAAIAYNADKEAIEAALAASPVGVTAVVTVGTTISIAFSDLPQIMTLPVVTADFASLTNATDPTCTTTPGTAGVATILEIDLGSATGGTFTVTVGAFMTADIDFDATAEEVVTAIGLKGITVTDDLAEGVHTITFGALTEIMTLPTVSATLTSLTGTTSGVAIAAGTTTYGTHKIVGFVNPNPIILSDTDDVLGVICVKGKILYSAIAALVASGDVTALQAALKDGLIPKGLVIQGLAGIH